MLPKLCALAATIAALAIAVPAASAATTSAKIGSYPCSVYASTPTVSGGFANANGWTSCSPNYLKRVEVQLYQLVTGGWQQVANGGWTAFTWDDPIGENVGIDPCVPGRWYADVALGQVGSSTASANTFSYGAQCP